MQSQSEQIWMYNRYEIVMEYAKRPRLPPPFVVISYIGQCPARSEPPPIISTRLGMLISNSSRQCVLKLKEYSDKKNSVAHRIRTQSSTTSRSSFHGDESGGNNPNSITPLVAQATRNNAALEPIVDRSLLGRLLNCKPCRQVTDNQRTKLVGGCRAQRRVRRCSEFRKRPNALGKTVKRICIGITRPRSSTRKHKKLTKCKRNSII